MSELENIIKKVVGHSINGLFHSPLGQGMDQMPGLGFAFYFRTILELDNGRKYDFGFDWIKEWDKDEALVEVNHQNWEINPEIKFTGVKIKDVLIDDNSELIFRLENDIIIYQGNFNGVTLHVQKYSEVFNPDGSFID